MVLTMFPSASANFTNPTSLVPSICYRCYDNINLADSSSIDFRKYIAPKESFAERYKRIAQSCHFKEAYEGHSVGENILIE